MATGLHRLTAKRVELLKTPGKYSDGGGLSLRITDKSKSWIFRYTTPRGRQRELGLGSTISTPLSLARQKAADARTLVSSGVDPAEQRKIDKLARSEPTFREAATACKSEIAPTFKRKKHGDAWLSTLQLHAFPHFGDRLVSEVDRVAIRDALLPIWTSKPDTARRVYQRIGSVLLWACAKGFRETEAPMMAIKKGLPRQPRRDRHFAAMPYGDVPAFMASLRTGNQITISRLALEFLILTAARSGEVRGADWREIDLEARIWSLPAERMKMARPHIVPLSDQAINLLERLKRNIGGGEGLLFPGAKAGAPMSDMTLTKSLRDRNLAVTVHGFRSSFRDWAADATAYPAEVAEAALAHSVGDATIAAYKRTDFLAKRRGLMADWGEY